MSAVAEQALGSAGMTNGQRSPLGSLRLRYGIEDKPPPVQMGLFGLQHVLVMFVAMVTPALTIGHLLDLSQDVRVTLVSSCMLGAGIGRSSCRWASGLADHVCQS